MGAPGVANSGSDLLARTAALVAVPSVSHEEATLADLVETELRAHGHLSVDRVGDNVVARTRLERATRVVLAGHLDTVPPKGNAEPRLEGDRLFGVGSTDMKGGLAVMLELARELTDPAVDVTYVFYAREEVAFVHSGLRELDAARPELLAGDVALLGEPTLGQLEAGCQGTMRVRVTLLGAAAHTARPWMGRNAIHRLAGVLTAVADYEPRRPVLQGCQFHEALQVVQVLGGTGANVVPDEAAIVLNHRFAPDRTPAQAEAHVVELVGPWLEDGDTVVVEDVAAGAGPALDHPVLAALVERNALVVSAKLGWTDVAFFAERGVAAANFGPGDSRLAHTEDEHLDRDTLESGYGALHELLTTGP